jgi:putative transposase
LAERAEDWPWSSARAHAAGKPDGLTDLAALAGVHRKWPAMLRRGVEAGDDLVPEDEGAINAHQRTGRPGRRGVRSATGGSYRPHARQAKAGTEAVP